MSELYRCEACEARHAEWLSRIHGVSAPSIDWQFSFFLAEAEDQRLRARVAELSARVNPEDADAVLVSRVTFQEMERRRERIEELERLGNRVARSLNLLRGELVDDANANTIDECIKSISAWRAAVPDHVADADDMPSPD